MIVYRITLEPYSYRLYASGRIARWNSKGTFMIYSASTRSLACLENIVHRGSEGLNRSFRTMVIEVPDELAVAAVTMDDLIAGWRDFRNQAFTRSIGDEWISKCHSPVLQVPSAIIPEEQNYLINPNHPDFKKINLLRTDAFEFDNRLTG